MGLRLLSGLNCFKCACSIVWMSEVRTQNNNNKSDTWMIRLTLLQIAQASNFPLQMFLLTFACINWVVLIQLENKGCCRRGTINEGEKKHWFRGDEIIIWNITKTLPSDSKSFTFPVQKSRFSRKLWICIRTVHFLTRFYWRHWIETFLRHLFGSIELRCKPLNIN